jgi:hypothetical protein
LFVIRAVVTLHIIHLVWFAGYMPLKMFAIVFYLFFLHLGFSFDGKYSISF